MKNFLTYTSIVEALTGLGLIIIPATVVRILLATELNSPLASLLAMIGGVAIFSVALACWMARSVGNPLVEIKMLLFYNAAVSLILIYSTVKWGFGGIAFWGIILFHIAQTIISLLMVKKLAAPTV